ncbi:MAG: TonB-dependent receptor [Burkholderiales bacterium]|nr:TonB-dependent receptor [Burkholderiales bacterium]
MLQTVTVTATRFPEDRLDAPVGMTVISAGDIAASTARTLPELLAQQAGVAIRDLTGSPDQQVDLRGFGITADQNTLLLLDGRRLDEIDLSNPTWSAIPLESIERIEIMRGSGAVLYGGGATGGTINIITRTPRRGTRSGSVAASVGRFDTFELRGASAIAGEQAGGTLALNHYESDNWRENNRVRLGNGEADLRWFGGNGQLGVKLGGDRQNLRLPGPRSEAQLTTDPWGTGTPDDWAARETARGLVTGEIALGGGQLAADLGYRESERRAFFGDYLFAGFFDQYVESRTGAWTFTPRLKLPYTAFGARHSLVVGYDYADWDFRRRQAQSQAMLGMPAVDLHADQRSEGVYAQHFTQLDTGTRITLGGRLQRVETKATDFANPLGPASASQKRSPRAYEIGVRQRVGEPVEVYGRYGQSFRVARVDEIYEQFGGVGFTSRVAPLEPQTSHDVELGVEYRAGSVRARAAAYQNRLNNEIYFFAPTFQNVNLPPTLRRGVELEGGWRPMPSLELFANLALRRAEFREGVIGGVDVAGNEVPLVPRVLGTLGANWNVTERTLVSAVARYVGSQRYDNDVANDFGRKMPSYTLVDLKLSHRIGDWKLSAALLNALDKFYYSYAVRSLALNTFNAYPSRPRTFVATVEYAFK